MHRQADPFPLLTIYRHICKKYVCNLKAINSRSYFQLLTYDIYLYAMNGLWDDGVKNGKFSAMTRF